MYDERVLFQAWHTHDICIGEPEYRKDGQEGEYSIRGSFWIISIHNDGQRNIDDRSDNEQDELE